VVNPNATARWQPLPALPEIQALIKAILFDWGGVFNLRHEAIAGYAELAGRYGHTPASFYDQLYSGPAWKQARTGALTARAYWAQMHAALGAGEDLDSFMQAMFAGDQVDPVLVALAELLRARYPLGLLSNALDDFEETLARRWQLAHLFDVVVNSARAGVAKPEPRAYELALAGLGVAAPEALFIDDKERNVVAALALGIPTIHFTTTPALLDELLARGILAAAEHRQLAALAPAAP
jgi:epoxide hydrolase-like predicted phosphatase